MISLTLPLFCGFLLSASIATKLGKFWNCIKSFDGVAVCYSGLKTRRLVSIPVQIKRRL